MRVRPLLPRGSSRRSCSLNTGPNGATLPPHNAVGSHDDTVGDVFGIIVCDSYPGLTTLKYAKRAHELRAKQERDDAALTPSGRRIALDLLRGHGFCLPEHDQLLMI